MCGITGFFRTEDTDLHVAESIIMSMTDSLIHRGPDDSNTLDSDSNMVFGHRRLSILDTSKSGLQPMLSKSENLVIVFNGEIYNHYDLRAQLEHEIKDIAWKSTSDTETLLAAFEHWGIDETLPKIRGMFAIALLDRAKKKFLPYKRQIWRKAFILWLDRGWGTVHIWFFL